MREPFADEGADGVDGLLLNNDGEIVAWGIDQEPDWYAAVSFWISADGTTWREVKLGVPDQFIRASDATNGPAGLVAVGSLEDDPAVWWSATGDAWELASFPEGTGYARAVASGPNGYLAVGSARRAPAAWFSVDGREWARVGDALGQRGWFSDVAATDDGFVVVGTDESGHDWDAAVWHVSPDGRGWRAAQRDRALAGPMDDSLYRVWAYAGGLLGFGIEQDTEERIDCYQGAIAIIGSTETAYVCIPSHDELLFRSRDGDRWERLPDSIATIGEFEPGNLRPWEFNAVQSWGEGLIAVGTSSDWRVRLWTSAGGARWEPIGDPVVRADEPPHQGQIDIINDLLVTPDLVIAGGSTDDPGEDGFVVIGRP